jgi:uncharacterized protein (TIGR00645 family)
MMDRVGEVSGEGLSEDIEARIRRNLGRLIFLARWIMAPIYLGLLASLCLVMVKFVQQVVGAFAHLLAESSSEIIIAVLSLVDLALVGNLVVIVMFSGWSSVVGPLLRAEAALPHGVLDFSTVKLRLVASIAAIAGIQILETFMHIEDVPAAAAMWQLLILLGIAVTGVLLALMDRLAERH